MQKNFPWGEVIRVHQIGEFTITEYRVNPVFFTEKEVEFSTGNASYDTLEQAIIGALCHKYDQPEAEHYIWKILN